MSFRNRYVIIGANGLINLTVPIEGGREQKTLIRDVKIDNTELWQTRHWRGITSAYAKAPFFSYYQEDVKSLLFSGEKFLFSFNIKIIEWVLKVLSLNTLLDYTAYFLPAYPDGEDCRNSFSPKSFKRNAGEWKPGYAQVFEDRLGFQPNVSILDLLFCEGPNAKHLLAASVK